MFGGGAQELSSLVAYVFIPSGQPSVFTPSSTVTTSSGTVVTAAGAVTTPGSSSATSSDPIAKQLLSGFALDLGSVVAGPTVADDFGQALGSVVDVVDLGSVPALAHPIAGQLESGVSLDLGATTTYPTLSDDFGSVADPVVDVINLEYGGSPP